MERQIASSSHSVTSAENDGASEFFGKFLLMGCNVHFTIQTCSIGEALDNLAKVDKNKLLILYLHLEEDDFSEKFCSYISNEQIGKMLHENFSFLGWDISEEPHRNSLINAINRFPFLRPCEKLISKGSPVVIFINLVDAEFRMCTVLRKIDDLDQLVSCLKDIVSRYCAKENETTSPDNAVATDYPSDDEENDNQISEFSNFKGYIGFQQQMCNGLGSRDYDCFYPDEMELLKQKISFALFGNPSRETGYDEKQQKQTHKMFEKILEENNKYSQYENQVMMAVVFNCLIGLDRQQSFDEYTPVPVFILRKCIDGLTCNSCRIIIDHTCRVYKSWNNYLKENKFCECLMVFPKDGRYMTDDSGEVILMQTESPACGVGKKTLKTADVAFLTRSNRKFNEQGIKFSAKGGDIRLNGIRLDPTRISSISSSDIASFYSDLSAGPRTPVEVDENILRGFSSDSINPNNAFVIPTFVAGICSISHGPILQNVLLLLQEIQKVQNDVISKIVKFLRENFTEKEFFQKLQDLILAHIQEEVVHLQKKYGKSHQHKLYFIRSVSNKLLEEFSSAQESLAKFIDFIQNWFVNVCMELEVATKRKNLLARTGKKQRQRICFECHGYYYW